MFSEASVSPQGGMDISGPMTFPWISLVPGPFLGVFRGKYPWVNTWGEYPEESTHPTQPWDLSRGVLIPQPPS